ncbi:MAG: cytochrome c oxidase assembly protein [Sphingomonadaceae bacterium]|nr:cytochrome c oxidase assembly protein [Sphingomonadaceae bacterium]
MSDVVPYCGTPPLPGDLLHRFNLDPILIAALLAAAVLHVATVRNDSARSTRAAVGWGVAAVALLSPLCALSVSLFAARVAQHMLLVLVAAPLLASSLRSEASSRALWPATLLFFAALWFWHMPVPYAATFRSDLVYWSMHVTLFGSGVWLWHALLRGRTDRGAVSLAAGTITSIQMGLLGAVLTLSSRPLFAPHYFTTEAWGFTPLADQQLGGALMWVPGCLLFLAVAIRSAAIVWQRLEPARS